MSGVCSNVSRMAQVLYLHYTSRDRGFINIAFTVFFLDQFYVVWLRVGCWSLSQLHTAEGSLHPWTSRQVPPRSYLSLLGGWYLPQGCSVKCPSTSSATSLQHLSATSAWPQNSLFLCPLPHRPVGVTTQRVVGEGVTLLMTSCHLLPLVNMSSPNTRVVSITYSRFLTLTLRVHLHV